MEFEIYKIIYYGSYIGFPLLVFFIYKRYIFLTILAILFIYARFIEPEILLVEEHKIKVGFNARYALIGDIHLGVYNNEEILKRTIEKINNLDVDAVLIAGDLLYQAELKDIKRLYSPLKDSKSPIYVVLGNHDYEKHQIEERSKLEEVLKEFNVNIINNGVKKLNGINIVGLGSHWYYDDDTNILNQFKEEDKVVVLAHNPDSTYAIKRKNLILLAGHTHGGQVRIPFLYKYVIPVKGDVLWDKGLYNYKEGKIFVTSGIGMIGLPLRFLVPPVIDILEFY